jgi:hypothetical protein
MKQIFLALLLVLNFIASANADETTVRRMTSGEISSGVIEAVGKDGSIRLSNGDTVQLWGLSIVDQTLAEKFLIGLTAQCGMLPNNFGYRIGDCSVYVPDNSDTFVLSIEPQILGIPLDLFVWLPHLSIAKTVCSDEMRVTNETLHTVKKYKYFCDSTRNPQRRFQFRKPLN